MLRQTGNPGIQALISVCGLSGRSLDSEDLAFRLGPRINAAGRLGSAVLALELLTTPSRDRADEIAAELERTNRERQRIEAKTLEEAREEIERMDLSSTCGLVVSRPEWHPGVIGIVASKIVDLYHRPTVLISEQGDVCQGSARSVPGFHIFEALRSCSSYLVSFGGHSQAAGVRLLREHLGDFARLFSEEVRRSLSDEDLVPVLSVDAEVSLAQVTAELVDELQRLAPFGKGNPPPVIGAQGVLVGGEPRRIGRKGKHLSFYARQGQRAFRVVAFGMGELAAALDGNTPIDLAFTPQINTFRGKRAVELVARDIRIPA
jgi:single-stranded-DNA-specific exonuclease